MDASLALKDGEQSTNAVILIVDNGSVLPTNRVGRVAPSRADSRLSYIFRAIQSARDGATRPTHPENCSSLRADDCKELLAMVWCCR